MGDIAKADHILGIGVMRLRFDRDVHLAYARVARDLGDPTAEKERWRMVLSRFPDCVEAVAGGAK
jgi:hypothetical protein